MSAQRLAIAWPHVAEVMQERPDEDTSAAWALCAGVPIVAAEKLGAVLLRHGLVREDGSVAPEAIAVMNALAARKLKELKR